MKILITGGAGSGKTTIIAALKDRGYIAIDLDDWGVCEWVNRTTGEKTEYQEGAGGEWIRAHRYQVDIPKFLELLDGLSNNKDVFIGVKPTSTQMDEIAKIFDVVYLLVASDDVLRERLATRKSNFAKLPEEREAIISGTWKFEETCLSLGAIHLDADKPVGDLLKVILAN